MKRALVSLPDGVWRIINELRGRMGNGDSEIIRNIVIAYLSERGILVPSYKVRAVLGPGRERQEAILKGLIEALVEAKILNQEDLDKRIRKMGAL